MQRESITGPLSPTELKASDEDTFYLFPELNNATKALITQRVTVSYDREQISINCRLRKVLTCRIALGRVQSGRIFSLKMGSG
jgi:hypothetical protein